MTTAAQIWSFVRCPHCRNLMNLQSARVSERLTGGMQPRRVFTCRGDQCGDVMWTVPEAMLRQNGRGLWQVRRPMPTTGRYKTRWHNPADYGGRD